MRSSRVSQTLRTLVEIGRPAFVWGAPGVGKSAVVQSLAKSLDRPVIDIRAPLLDPTDLRGLPAVVDGRAVWAPPSFLPVKTDKPGILFFDELNAAPPLVQASLYQLVLDRRVGEYVLPDGWQIIAAGNRAEDRSVVFRMPAALANRFIHLEFEPHFDDWSEWAVTAGVSPVVIAFIAVRRELLAPKPGEADGIAFASPRSWHMLSDAYLALGTEAGALEVYQGCVGKGAAIEFLEHAKKSLSIEVIERIIARPDDAVLPTNAGDLWVLVKHIAQRVREPKVTAALGSLLGRLGAEWAVRLARDILRVSPALAFNPAVAAFAKRNADVLVPKRAEKSGCAEGVS
jgi:AAA domain (dynein-related subfamily)